MAWLLLLWLLLGLLWAVCQQRLPLRERPSEQCCPLCPFPVQMLLLLLLLLLQLLVLQQLLLLRVWMLVWMLVCEHHPALLPQAQG